MASEVTVTLQLAISNVQNGGSFNHRSSPTQFTGDLGSVRGPYPGLVVATLDGTDVSFTPLVRAGYIWMHNLDPDNYVEFGVHDGSLFHPLGEIDPGTFCLFKLSRNLGEEHTEPGTGTGPRVNTFMIRADTAPCDVQVFAFDR